MYFFSIFCSLLLHFFLFSLFFCFFHRRCCLAAGSAPEAAPLTARSSSGSEIATVSSSPEAGCVNESDEAQRRRLLDEK